MSLVKVFDFHPEGWRDLSSGNLEHSVCAPDVSLWKTEGERIESEKEINSFFFFFFFDKMIGLMDLGDEE